ncbi:hypothetical protein [Stenomitos frigidus]|uniref:Uncharacterized protein n=1 Tax=Stenomitos frigidus ULC18 TaxID=2107698 RepID=A0A2T1DXX8_9CYAN|nr:hypothetical protein [Stenomitos frigidus]PSB25366.1 hypothetical protein C7B82_23850 [Stenomitos frigidus ULC18]
MKLADFPFISKHEASKLLGVSVTTLNRWRKDPSKEWQQETHYTQRDSGEWEYNQTLLEKWRDRRLDPHGYINALQQFQQAIEASQRKGKRSA